MTKKNPPCCIATAVDSVNHSNITGINFLINRNLTVKKTICNIITFFPEKSLTFGHSLVKSVKLNLLGDKA